MDSPEPEKKADVRRPMNAFLIFCKRHRSMVREKNPDLDNRSVTRILGDLWANLGETEKSVYTSLAKQYKDAFMKANPDYKWHNPDKGHQTPTKMTTRPTNARVVKSAQDIHLDGTIMPGKLADPSKMGGLSLLLMAGQQSMTSRPGSSEGDKRVTSPDKYNASKSALLALAEMCANELQQEEITHPNQKSHTTKMEGVKRIRSLPKKQLWMMGERQAGGKVRSKSESDSNFRSAERRPIVDILKLVQSVKEHDAALKEKSDSKDEVDVFASQSESSMSKEDSTHSSKKKKEIPVQRVRSWSESANDHGKLSDDSSDHSGYTAVKVKGEGERSRRMSQSETIAGCLSDQNDNAIVSCGKLVVDHIVEKLLGTDIAQQAMKLKGVSTIEELKQSLIADELVGQRVLGEGCRDGQHENSRIESLVDNLYEKREAAAEVKKDYEPILRVPDVKSFLETNENQKRLASEALGAETSEVKAKKRPVTLPLEEVKPEPTEDVVTPETRGDKYEHDYLCGGEDDGKDKEENDGYQPVRKSRRRNRGQRYLELINEGIIQPSKERLAARRAEQTSEDESLWCYEDIVMEEEVQEVRRPTPKRSGSDSDGLEEKKYKTGDFDLEAQIATLPPCSLDPVSRGNRQKNATTKIRHHSDGSGKKSATVTSPSTAPADITTLTLPPHVKLQSEPVTTQAVSGSRKRKARKHSINHLLPVSQRPGDDKNIEKQGEGAKETENKDSGKDPICENVQSSKDLDSSSSQESYDREEKPEVKKELEEGCESSQSGDRSVSMSQSGNSPSDLSLSGNSPTDLSQSGNTSTDLSQSGNSPTDLSQSGDRSTDLSQSGNRPTDLSQSGNKPTDLSQSGKMPTNLSQSGKKPADLSLSGYNKAYFSQSDDKATGFSKSDDKFTRFGKSGDTPSDFSQSQSVLRSEKGCDRNTNVGTSESDVLDFRTLQSRAEVFQKEEGENNLSMGQVPSNVDEKLMQNKPNMSSGPMNLSEKDNLIIVDSSKAANPSGSNFRKGNNSKGNFPRDSNSTDSVKGDKSQSPSCEQSLKVEIGNKSSTLTVHAESSESLKGDNSQSTSFEHSSKVEQANNSLPLSEESPGLSKGHNSQCLPNSSASPEEKVDALSSSSTVNIVAFSTASAPSTVDLVSLTTTSVTQGVSLEVLGEQAESPTSSMTRSPIAAGSPSKELDPRKALQSVTSP